MLSLQMTSVFYDNRAMDLNRNADIGSKTFQTNVYSVLFPLICCTECKDVCVLVDLNHDSCDRQNY